jgi:hypothetical protein
VTLKKDDDFDVEKGSYLNPKFADQVWKSWGGVFTPIVIEQSIRNLRPFPSKRRVLYDNKAPTKHKGETVEDYLARGGVITKAPPAMCHGCLLDENRPMVFLEECLQGTFFLDRLLLIKD